MNTPNQYIDTLLEPLIEYLQEQQPLVYGDDYENLFTEFGYDICSGDGSVSSHVESLLEQHVQQLPLSLKNWFWWHTSSGRVEEEWIHDIMQSTPPKLDTLENDEEALIKDVVQLFYERLRKIAEDSYEETECAYDDIDEDEWGNE